MDRHGLWAPAGHGARTALVASRLASTAASTRATGGSVSPSFEAPPRRTAKHPERKGTREIDCRHTVSLTRPSPGRSPWSPALPYRPGTPTSSPSTGPTRTSRTCTWSWSCARVGGCGLGCVRICGYVLVCPKLDLVVARPMLEYTARLCPCAASTASPTLPWPPVDRCTPLSTLQFLLLTSLSLT